MPPPPVASTSSARPTRSTRRSNDWSRSGGGHEDDEDGDYSEVEQDMAAPVLIAAAPSGRSGRLSTDQKRKKNAAAQAGFRARRRDYLEQLERSYEESLSLVQHALSGRE